MSIGVASPWCAFQGELRNGGAKDCSARGGRHCIGPVRAPAAAGRRPLIVTMMGNGSSVGVGVGVLFTGAFVQVQAQELPPAPDRWVLTAQYPDERGEMFEHGDTLKALLNRWSDRGLRLQIDLPPPAAWRARDQKLRWSVNSQLPPVKSPRLSLADDHGVEVWSGPDPDSFADLVELVLTAPDHGAARRAQFGPLPGYVARHIEDGPAIPQAVERYRRALPHCGFAHACCVVDALWHRGDLDEARRAADAAIAALASEPWSLAKFADLALRADPHDRELAGRLAAALGAAVAALPDVALPRLALLRARLRADPEHTTPSQTEARTPKASSPQDSLSLSESAWPAAARTPVTAIALAEILAAAPNPEPHAPLAHRALDAAAKLGADPLWLAAARYAVVLRCDRDADGAASVVAAHLARAGEQADLNGTAWRLMTEFATMGRFDAFALALADRLLEQQQRGRANAAHLDTIALAQFVNGRFADAVANEEKAIALDGDDPRFAARLQRYRRFQAMAAAGR
jgi:tetratricopeptide (TPR) repeat protein